MKKELQNNFIIISIIILCVLITCVILYFIFKPHKQNYVNTKYFRDIRENFDIKELLLNKQCKDGNCVGLGKGFLLRDIDFLSSDSLDSFFIEGKDVKSSELHGLSQREGSVETHIKFGKKVW